MTKPPAPMNKRALLLGLLPLIAYTVIEEMYGLMAGLIAGVALGLGEIIYELWKYKKVSSLTLISNGLIFVLGGISVISSDGIWFKLQPAILEGIFSLGIWGFLLFGKNLFILLAEKQGATFPEPLKNKMKGLAFRVGLFFAAHAILATYAAFYWTTTEWALLKGVGLTVSFIAYLALEMLVLRMRLS